MANKEDKPETSDPKIQLYHTASLTTHNATHRIHIPATSYVSYKRNFLAVAELSHSLSHFRGALLPFLVARRRDRSLIERHLRCYFRWWRL